MAFMLATDLQTRLIRTYLNAKRNKKTAYAYIVYISSAAFKFTSRTISSAPQERTLKFHFICLEFKKKLNRNRPIFSCKNDIFSINYRTSVDTNSPSMCVCVRVCWKRNSTNQAIMRKESCHAITIILFMNASVCTLCVLCSN